MKKKIKSGLKNLVLAAPLALTLSCGAFQKERDLLDYLSHPEAKEFYQDINLDRISPEEKNWLENLDREELRYTLKKEQNMYLEEISDRDAIFLKRIYGKVNDSLELSN